MYCRSAIFARLFAFVVLAAGSGPTSAAAAEPTQHLTFYIGTYTGGASEGIYRSSLDPATGALAPAELAARIKNPSFLAVHPSGEFLYAVGEISDFAQGNQGAISSFKIGPSAKLQPLNQQPSGGAGPCHLVVDATGQNVLVANYGGGTVACLPIDAGKLAPPSAVIQHQGRSVHPRRQSAPHAHSINLDSSNRFAMAADLGIDKVLVYAFDPQRGTLTPHDAASLTGGAGPRHFCFHPSGKFAYVINELALTVTAFSYDADQGRLTTLQSISTLPASAHGEGFSTAEVVAHPSGRFLYGSNRGHDSIAVFAVDPQSGKLSFLEAEATQGNTPRNFALDPTGSFLLAENQGSGSIVVFRIDPERGVLDATGHRLEVPSPVCIRFLP